MLKLSSRKSIVSFLVIVFAVMIMLAGASVPVQAYSTFTTDEYNVTIDVHEDNTFTVTEEIKIYALSPMHGIYRYIPLKGNARMEIDGVVTGINRSMEIRNIRVDGYDFKEYNDSGNKVIKIGSKNYTVTGSNTYVIHYDCTAFRDSVDSKDFFYYNVIPHGWETPVSSAHVTVNMPKDFDEDRVWAARGYSYGYAAEDNYEMSISGNTVTISAEDLERNEGITLQIDLDEGYFVGAKSYDWLIYVLYGIIALSVILAAFLWFTYGRDKLLAAPVQFYPPEGITPAEAGYILDGFADKKDIVSMIIWFADKGYIRIKEKTETADGIAGKLFKKEETVYYLHKLKEYRGDKPFARTLFTGLFLGGDKVSIDELAGEFYDFYTIARGELRDYHTEDPSKQLFTKSSNISRILALVLTALPIASSIVISGIVSHTTDVIMVMPVMAISTIFGYMIVVSSFDRRYSDPKKKLYTMAILGGIFVATIGYSCIYVCRSFCGISLAAELAFAASVVIAGFTAVMKKRNDESAEMLGNLLGFKEFIKLAEKERIELLVNQDSEYFYNVLPYAYVFGLTDEWAENFEGIAVEPPGWYDGYYDPTFDTWVFLHMFDDVAEKIKEITVPPADSDGGDSGGGGSFGGGGGFSGGGFGGGGGGGW